MKEARLSDLCKIQYGFAFDSTRFSATTGSPLVRIRDIVRGYSETYTTEQCSEEYLVNNGDLLIGMDGEFNIARWKGGPALLNQRVCRLLPKEGIDKSYLFYFMPKALKQIEAQTSFVTVKHLSAKQLNSIVVPLPAPEKQMQIVSTLDKLDSLISLRKQQLAKLDELVKARFVEMFGDVSNGSKHPGIPLGEICSTLSGGTPTTKVPEYYQGDIPWISTPYLGDNHINGRNAKAYITQDAIKNSATHLIPKNTIVFGIRVGVGKSSIIDDAMCTNQDIVALMNVNSHKYNLLFLKHVLDSYQSYFNSIKKGATILGITTDDLKKVVVPNVELDLQEQFAAFVDQTDKSKLTIQKSLAKLEVLKKSLMQKYFG